MDYISGGGRKRKTYYRIKKNKGKTKHKATVSRISCKDYDDPKKNKKIGRIVPKVGDSVTIIVKPYRDYKCIKGTVERVLTKKQFHSRGHKVLLTSGIIGRTLKVH